MNRRTASTVARLTAITILVMASGILASCAGLGRNPNVVGTYSDKLSTYNYREEGDLVLMVVGVEGARLIRDEPYFPLFVLVANKTKETFSVTREAFTLEDPLGHQYAMAPPRDVAEKYHRLDLDRRMFRQNASITGTYVGLFTRIESDFFPSSARKALQINAVTLPPRTVMQDVLYYPIPESGLNGVPLHLFFNVKELSEPVSVVFEVPRTLGVFEKEDDVP
jgi:hypothetical protein